MKSPTRAGTALLATLLSLPSCAPPATQTSTSPASTDPASTAPASTASASATTVLTLAGSGATILVAMPPTPPTAVVVMFAGNDGAIGIRPDGSIQNAGNFLIRTRPRWIAAGLAYVAIDTPSGESRVGPANQRAIAETLAAIRQRTPAPVWLVGTSAGAPAALDGAASLPQGTIAGAIAGVIVSSPVTQPGPRETVFDAALDRIATPVLIQVHQTDACAITPPGKAPALKAALSRAPTVEIQQFQGGLPPRSRPCQAASPHGFLGIEPEVVAAATRWIASH